MLTAGLVLFQVAFIVRVLLRTHRDPASRIAWIAVILALPVVGMAAYLLLGETNIGRDRVEHMKAILAARPDIASTPGFDAAAGRPDIPERYLGLFKVGHSISGFEAVGGNQARLMADSNATIDAMVADIDKATRHVHVLFYIWMPDNNGRKFAEALCRAAARGVACRAMVDDLGSRLLINSDLWTAMEAAGVKLGRALRIGNQLLRVFAGKDRSSQLHPQDPRSSTTRSLYCGSQNCADPEFRTKAKFAPWVDAVMRFTGPIVRQNQYLFAADWMAYNNEDLRAVLLEPIEPPEPGFAAQVVASGPTGRYSAASEMFETLMYSARRELFITTPYYVPNDAMQAALCAAANRGVETTIIFPARNDDRAVQATSRKLLRR